MTFTEQRKHAISAAAKTSLVAALALGLGGFVVADQIAFGYGALGQQGESEWDMRNQFSSREFSRTALELPALRSFTVGVDGAQIPVESNAQTLAQALTDAGIALGAQDVVSADLNTLPPDGASITIVRVAEGQVVEETVDSHTTTEVETDELYEGQRRVITKGVDGRTITTYQTTVHNGVEESRELVAQTVATLRVDEVVEVGTKARPATATGGATAPAAGTYAGSPVEIGQSMAAARGWSGDQWSCLYSLWSKESGWNPNAHNSRSGAHGIPQALPGSKMASHGADWATNPATQIAWGLDYIAGRYGTPCAAWNHSVSRGWY